MFKKTFLIILIYTLFSSSSISASFNWTKIKEASSDEMAIFYDKKTVFKVGEYIYFWQLTNYLKNIENDIHSIIVHNIVNCDTYELKIVSYADFKRPMARGMVDLEMIVPEQDIELFKWNYFDKNSSAGGPIITEVCN